MKMTKEDVKEIHKKMMRQIEVIKSFCDTMNNENEFFLYPLYSIVSESMATIALRIALLHGKSQLISGADTTEIIVSELQKQIDDVRGQLEKRGKSHNQELAERLLREAGLSDLLQ